jgi:hypothetical protein
MPLQSRFRSPSERLESPSPYTESGASPHSRAPSLDSSADVAVSHSTTPASNAPTFLSPRLAQDSNSSPMLDKAAEEAHISERSRHKFSDSHSSLSSYTSSFSGFHSRISSVTTVSGMATEMYGLDSKLGHLPESTEMPMLGTIQPPSPMYPNMQQQNFDYGVSRPHCPRLLSPTEILSQNRSQADGYFAPTSKLHKRTVSAPNCRATSTTSHLTPTKQSYPVLPPPHSIFDPRRMSREPSPIMAGRHGSAPRQDSELESEGPRRHSAFSSYSDHSRSVSLDPARGMSQAPAPIPEDASPSTETALNAEACCMFVENCNTGSQLRKAISHLFGRNKNCTQRIPKHVWVYYCRKHYQRVRYRNAKTYPLTQMELVKVQIHRLQTWSVKNQSESQGSHIESWEFSLRKREQKRLDGEAGPGDDSDDENGSGPGSTGVPGWIVQSLGKGYKTEQILEIVDRLYDELEKGQLTQVPEVEFLPNIVEEGNEGAAKPGRGRRNNSTTSASGAKAHKRKASDVSMIMEQAEPRHYGYAGQHDDAAADQISPLEKRIRVDNAGGFSPTRAVPASWMQQPVEMPLRLAPANRCVGLPSISQGPMTFLGEQRQPQQPQPKPSSMDSTGYAPHRPMHQRSASAFTFTDRRAAPYSRQSSPGLEGQTGYHGLDMNASGHSRYGLGSDAPRTFHGSHGPRSHGHGHSQSLSLSRSPFLGQPMMHGMGHSTPAMSPDVVGRR